jgi:uncharacterized protein (UPF0264 family)
MLSIVKRRAGQPDKHRQHDRRDVIENLGSPQVLTARSPLLVPAPADAGATVAMVVTTTADGRRR